MYMKIDVSFILFTKLVWFYIEVNLSILDNNLLMPSRKVFLKYYILMAFYSSYFNLFKYL